MNTNQKILMAIIIIITIGIALFIIGSQPSATIETSGTTTSITPDNTDRTPPMIYTKQEVIQILRTDKDALNYMNRNRDFTMNITPLSKADILTGQNATNFREVYQNLTPEDNRYLKVDLMNMERRGLITVVDMKKQAVVKLYGIVLVNLG